MKKLILFFIVNVLICTNSFFAQVNVINNTTIKYGNYNSIIGTDYVAKYCDAQGSQLGSSGDKGMLIETGNSESSGIYLDGDKIVIWSPGDDNIINFCDEDGMGDPDFHNAIVAYIDDGGYYFQISDSTKKENIQTIVSALSKISRIRGVEYVHKVNLNSKDSQDKKTQTAPKKNLGFLAQEVEEVVPEAVKTSSIGIKYVNYQALIPVLVEAVKEQQEQLTEQQKQILLLQQQLKQLENLVNTLTSKSTLITE
jgi:hypothetical protein